MSVSAVLFYIGCAVGLFEPRLGFLALFVAVIVANTFEDEYLP